MYRIDAQHGLPLQKYKDEEGFKQAVDALDASSSSFKASWSLPVLPDVRHLKEFCGGTATAIPTTAKVESDFSRIGVGKDDYRQSLTNFSLEGYACTDSNMNKL
jgi:hypothetical protein